MSYEILDNEIEIEKENENEEKKLEEREGVNQQRKKYYIHICLRHLDY